MSELHYCGFNGYKQSAEFKSLPKIIHNLTSVVIDDVLDLLCVHRILIVKMKDHFKIYGCLDENDGIGMKIVKPPVMSDIFLCTEEFLLVSQFLKIWKSSYCENWIEVDTKCTSESKLWEGSIIKINCYINNNLIILLRNGSIWKLIDNKLQLIFSPDVEKAIDISSGFEHSLILTESGCVLSVGAGSRGQLGNGDLNAIETPEQIAALEGCKTAKIAAGGWHSCAVTDTGDLYTWGWNNFGQLSQSDLGLSAVPALIDFDSDLEVLQVACGNRHTIVMLENEEIYSTGWNGYGQLGIGPDVGQIEKFTKINFKGRPDVKLYCGPWSSIIYSENKS